MTHLGIAGWGYHVPAATRDYHELARLTGIPAGVIRDKFGIEQVYVAGPADQPSTMAVAAAEKAMAVAGVAAAELDLIIYHGSEYKDHIVWSIATKIQQLLGADRATAFEIYSLCAGAGVAMSVAEGLAHSNPRCQNILLVAASRELDLLDYANERSRFMINFSAGAGALVLQRDLGRNRVIGTAVRTDGSLADTVVMPAGGSQQPPSTASLAAAAHVLDVPDVSYMRQRLGEVSLPNFVGVIDDALAAGGKTRADLAFVGMTHMKASFNEAILAELGLGLEQTYYLSRFGHIQSADQAITLTEGLAAGRINAGDVLALAGAGTGYTWSATAVTWG